VRYRFLAACILAVFATASCAQRIDTTVASLEKHDPKRALVLLDTSIFPLGDDVPRDVWYRITISGVAKSISTGGKRREGPWLYSVPAGMYWLLITSDVHSRGYYNPTQKILFYVRPGEFVYVGQIFHQNIPPNSFDIGVVDDYEAAIAYFRKTYPNSTRTPTKRLTTIVRVPRNRSAQSRFSETLKALIKRNPERFGYTREEVGKAR
jgi:hypothetical protein